MILVGVDPSTTALGIAILDVTCQPTDPVRAAVWTPGPNDVQVLRSWTLRPNTKLSIGDRCRRIQNEMFMIAECEEVQAEDVRYVIEDPTGATFAGRGAGGAAAKVGAAFGAAYCGLHGMIESHLRYRASAELVVVPAQVWLPRVRGRRGSHPMSHNNARRWLKLRWPALEELPDDETFAAGVALYAVTKHPMVVAA